MGVLDMEKVGKAIRARKAGPFHLSDLYGADWAALWMGDKVAAKGEFPRVEDTGKKAAGGRIDRKVGS